MRLLSSRWSNYVGDSMSDQRQNRGFVAAGFAERVAAMVIDSLVLIVIVGLGVLACSQPVAAIVDSSVTMAPVGWFGPIFYLIGLGIAIHWLWTWAAQEGRSPGRAAMGLALVGEDLQPLGYQRVAFREITRSLIYSTGIGTIVNIVIVKKQASGRSQALHDSLPFVASHLVSADSLAGLGAPVAATAPAFSGPALGDAENWPGFADGMTVDDQDNPWSLPEPPSTSQINSIGHGEDAGLAAFVSTEPTQQKPKRGFSYATDKAAEVAAGTGPEPVQPVDPDQPEDAVVVDLTEEPTGGWDAVPVDVTEPGAETPLVAVEDLAPAQDDADAYPVITDTGSHPIPTTQWVLLLDGGQQVVIGENRCLLGRKPAIEQDDLADATLVPIRDENLSMSKIHALMGVDEDGLWIVDWESRNGSFVAPAGQEWEQLEAGQPYRLIDGDAIRFGQVEAEVTVQEVTSITV